jgi:catechol 2,3-dioxygenase-like lactoylglutathione lyase family enzyme
MKRIHIHVGVEDLDQSIRFYNALLGAQPIKTKSDYAKWMLDDPCLNFAISTRPGKTGVDHLGVQVDEDSTLEELRERFKSADMSVYDEGETVCCYARSDKTWVKDPSGVAWEAYKTMEDVELFSSAVATEDGALRAAATNGQQGCCKSPEKTVGCCG